MVWQPHFLSQMWKENIDHKEIDQDQTQGCLGFLGSRSPTQTFGILSISGTDLGSLGSRHGEVTHEAFPNAYRGCVYRARQGPKIEDSMVKNGVSPCRHEQI